MTMNEPHTPAELDALDELASAIVDGEAALPADAELVLLERVAAMRAVRSAIAAPVDPPSAAVREAGIGHIGLPLGCAELATVLWASVLRHDPQDPGWPARDRFVLSAGHGSMLLYSLLHLSGYAVSEQDIRGFRKLGSITPGHPEVGVTPGSGSVARTRASLSPQGGPGSPLSCGQSGSGGDPAGRPELQWRSRAWSGR